MNLTHVFTGSNPVWRTIKLVPDENLLRVFSSNMYGGYSVAGLTRQFVALKTVSSNLTTHPTEYVLHYAERIFLFTYSRATFGRSFFYVPPTMTYILPTWIIISRLRIDRKKAAT